VLEDAGGDGIGIITTLTTQKNKGIKGTKYFHRERQTDMTQRKKGREKEKERKRERERQSSNTMLHDLAKFNFPHLPNSMMTSTIKTGQFTSKVIHLRNKRQNMQRLR